MARKPWALFALIVVLGGCTSLPGTVGRVAPMPTVTPAPTWYTIATWTEKDQPDTPTGHLPLFTVTSDTWRVGWVCTDPLIIGVVPYSVEWDLRTKSGSVIWDDTYDEDCNLNNGRGYVAMSSLPSTYYLQINSYSTWQISVQELVSNGQHGTV